MRFSHGAVIAATSVACGLGQAAAQTPSFTWLGSAPGTPASQVLGLSADGRAAAGFSLGLTHNTAFRWTASDGRYDFGLEPGLPIATSAIGISGDGRVVVGQSANTTADIRAFRWEPGINGSPGTFQTLGTLGLFPSSKANAASGDGSIVVGTSSDRLLAGQAFRWTQATGMQSLPLGPGGIYNEAKGISRDGGTIVGYSADSGGFTSALVWSNGGVQVLPQLPGTTAPRSQAVGVSADGSVVVGVSGDQTHPTMWVNSVPVDLGLLPGFGHGFANAVNSNGTVVACTLYGTPVQDAYAAVWTPTTSMQLLSEYLAANGVTVPSGWRLAECIGISDDGSTFAGNAMVPGQGIRGFVATIPAPGGVAVLLTTIHMVVGRRRR